MHISTSIRRRGSRRRRREEKEEEEEGGGHMLGNAVAVHLFFYRMPFIAYRGVPGDGGSRTVGVHCGERDASVGV